MEKFDSKLHWENIYQTKKLEEVSWYQKKPDFSLDLIKKYATKTSSILDVGGGDSFLVDYLIDEFDDVSILDISENAIQRAKNRLENKSNAVEWIVSDVLEFKSSKKYDIWYDRAAFHFLNSSNDIEKYVSKVNQYVALNGHIIIGTFSKNGPQKCSGIEIKQYSIKELNDIFVDKFKPIESFTIDHTTPTGSVQNFTFVVMRKITL